MTDDKMINCTVAIVGGGPAGLALATELKTRGVDNVVVLEREGQAGGVPRHCGHYPFGFWGFKRLMKGPEYARALVQKARAAGVEIRTGHTVTALHPNARLGLSTAEGAMELQAERVVLCTGVRESSRAQRFIGGARPQGVISTGALQSMVYLHGMRPFRRPVIIGTELV
ncbi:MAG TPA: FAD-dependent oxidoreductase, partial [Roseibacterium sp.]|nr:FAD-dependent oxidoreductase [Roseibacterium sp.]